MKKISLDKINIGDEVIITDINKCLILRRRLYDLGIIPGSTIKKEFTSPFNDPCAYLIKGTTIALRNDEAKKILVKYYE